MNPLRALGALMGDGTPITDLYLQVRVDGDMGLLRGIMKHLFEAEDLNPGQVVDRAFIAEHTTGFESFEQNIRNTSWEDIEEVSGISRAQLLEGPTCWPPSRKSSPAGPWASRSSARACKPSRKSNLQLMKGAIGKPGAGTLARYARCAATPTCRATAPWASGSSPPRRFDARYRASTSKTPRTS